MTTFDVFINGIQAKRLGESEQIKQELAEFLQMDSEKVEQLINDTFGKRIFRNVSGPEAEQYQKDIQALGAICVYRPNTQSASLSLVAIEEEKVLEELRHCPNCDYKFSKEEVTNIPEKCAQCGISIQKFLNIKKLETERELQLKVEKEEIRKRLLHTENTKKSIAEQKRQQLAEERRLKQLEEEIKKELAIKKDKKPLIYAGSALLITVIAMGGYTYYTQPDEQYYEHVLDGSDSFGTTEGSSQSPELEGEQVAVDTPQDSQQSLQQAHDQASKVLDSFGLDPDAFAENSTPAQAGSGALIKPDKHNSATTVSSFLLNEDSNNQLWNRFLVNQINAKIAGQKELTAYHLSQYLTDTKSYIDMQGKLLTMTRQAKNKKDIYSGIESKISVLPIQEQIQFLTQAGVQQYKVDSTHSLLDQASTIEKNLTSPEDLLDATLHLGVAYYQLGSVNIANQYFGKINGLVSKISSIDKKVHSRVEIAKAYKDANSDANALQWLLSTKKLIPNASNVAFTEIVTAYAYLDHLEGTLKTIQQRPSYISQDALLYEAIQVFVSNGSYHNADKLLARIQEPDYKASSNILIASSVQKNSHYLSFTETLLKNEISHPLDKAIISSQLALQYSAKPNNQKTNALFQLTKEHLNSVPSSLEKDEALNIISTNFARTLNTTYAKELLALIQSPIVHSNLEAEMGRAVKVASLIN